jgi:hypothetical protein
MSITILTANLLTTAISSYLVNYRSHVKPLAFIVCLTILCCFYARMWYHIDLFRIILRGEAGNYL